MTTFTRTLDLAPDAVLPQRHALLDPINVAAILAREFNTTGPVEIVRSKYRIGESLRVLYRVTNGDPNQLFTARTFRRNDLDAAVGRAAKLRDAGAVGLDANTNTVWWSFPADRKLRNLDQYLHPTNDARRSLRVDRWTGSDVVTYAQERCVTLRAQYDGQPSAYVKCFAPGESHATETQRRLDEASRVFANVDARLGVARVLGVHDDAIAFSAVPGTTWLALSAPARHVALELLGRAVAALHAYIEPTGLGEFQRTTVDRIRNSVEIVGQSLPGVGPIADAIRERVSDAASRLPASSPVFLHGDCHPLNIVVDQGQLTMIDFDQAGAGNACADICSVRTYLRYAAHMGIINAEERTSLGASFMRGYQCVRSLPSDEELRFFDAATIVTERAVRIINRINRPAFGVVEPLLREALELLP